MMTSSPRSAKIVTPAGMGFFSSRPILATASTHSPQQMGALERVTVVSPSGSGGFVPVGAPVEPEEPAIFAAASFA